MDHAALRSWCPQCVKGRAESCGHVTKLQNDGEAPTMGVDYMHTHSEQDKEEEKGMPSVVAKNTKTKMIMARVARRAKGWIRGGDSGKRLNDLSTGRSS